MRKKRILFCSEATFLNTGYATYTREILKYLHSTGKYEIAELASYGEFNDPRAKDIPWKFYGVQPDATADKQKHDAYNSRGTNQFGEWIFEHVCLDFFPDIVCDIRDFWMLDFQERSPFRPFYKWAIMPTVDAAPQHRQWIATYANADAVFTYSDWAGDVLKLQGNGRINYLGSAPPSAHPAYQPVSDKADHKRKFGIDPSYRIIGTVMRNQRRKLYPDLFEAFKSFLDASEDKKFYLYCHTSYPDLGWDIPELIQEYGLASHVLFTYKCPETKKIFPSLYRGAVTQSPFTNHWGSTLCNVKNGAEYDDLAAIINLFDLYIQYANCEGFGLPQVEAAACGVPVMSTDYSAMESVIRQLDGIPVTPKAHYKELETGCMRAVPDNALAARQFKSFFDLSPEQRADWGKSTRRNFEKHFQWDMSGGQWEKYFDSVEILPIEQTWGSAPRIRQPEPAPKDIPQNTSHQELARWLIAKVFCEPEKINTYLEARLTRDLMYRTATASTGGMYFNEMGAAFETNQMHQEFTFDNAYQQMRQMCDNRNAWEQMRMQAIQNRKPE